MKKVKLSKSMKKQSSHFLKGYLLKDRKRPLTTRVKQKVKKLIQKKEKNFDVFADEIIKSPLFTLAVAEIIREGYNRKIFIDGQEKYDIPPSRIMLKMLEIVDVANRQGQKKMLEDYCRRKK